MYQQLGSALLGNGLGQTGSNLGGLSNLLSGGLKCSQNEQRLMAEKQQRNLLKRYLTQATGDPIQSALISNTIPGRGAGDTFDVGLGTKNSIMQSLGLSNTASQNTSILQSLTGNNSTLGALGSLSKLGQNQAANPGLLSSLVSMASTPNNNGNILRNLGGLGTGFIGGNTGNSGGLLGSLQSGMNTLNTLNKVNNAVSGVTNLLA